MLVDEFMYLLVLSFNAIVAIRRGLAASPGELPVWGTPFVFTTAATATAILSISDSRGIATTRAPAS